MRIGGEIAPQRRHGLIHIRRFGELGGERFTRVHVQVAAIVVDRHRRVAALAVIGDILDQPAARVGVQLGLEIGRGRRPIHLIVDTPHVGRRQLHDAIAGLAVLHVGHVAAGDRDGSDVRLRRGIAEDPELRAAGRAQRRGEVAQRAHVLVAPDRRRDDAEHGDIPAVLGIQHLHDRLTALDRRELRGIESDAALQELRQLGRCSCLE